MATQLFDIGEEFERKLIFEGSVSKPSNVEIGLYHDGEISGDTTNGDGLPDDASIDDIQTEPDDGNYLRQSVAFDNTGFSTQQNAHGDWEATVDGDVEFDVSDTTGDVDAYFVVVSWDRDGDGTSEDHLYWSGNLEDVWSLGEYTDFNVETVGVAQD